MSLEKILSVLPPVENIKVKSEADFYGASYIIADLLHIPLVPRSQCGWKHGWLFTDLKYTQQITGVRHEPKYLVPLKEHELFLQENGIEAKAVGMPFIYVEDIDKREIPRYKRSLLVMPPHSLSTSNHSWDEDTYAQQINELKSDFDLIVVCLYHACIEKNLWVEAFQKYDIPWILGANSLDRNSLIRMNRLFRSFEFMTTNAIGSHIVYAAYRGCKVSIYGAYSEYSEEDFKDDTLYNKYPFLLKHNLEYSSEKSVKSHYPFLFTHPLHAKSRVEWAGKELGKAYKVSHWKLAKHLGWLPWSQFAFYGEKVYIKIKKYFDGEQQ
jgi:hypothetical protein